MEGLYTIEELTKSIIDDFQLPLKVDEDFRNYYQRIYRALVNADILKAGIEKINPITKRKCKYYTEQHKQTILSERTLYDYVRNKSSSPKYQNSKRYNEIQEDIARRQQEHNDKLESRKQEENDDNIPNITDKELQEHKNNIMLTALFEKFFTPINIELLFNDLCQILITKDESNLQIEDIEAENRLLNPNGSYFQER